MKKQQNELNQIAVVMNKRSLATNLKTVPAARCAVSAIQIMNAALSKSTLTVID